MPTTIIGKTYSLCDEADSSDAFYARLAALADECVQRYGSNQQLLDFVSKTGRRKHKVEHLMRMNAQSSREAYVVQHAAEVLGVHTPAVETHLASLPFRSRFSRTMTMSRGQYHLAMLEIELTNRVNRQAFLDAAYRIALLPHCLRDFSRECLAKPDEFDHECRGCSKSCAINAVSRELRTAEVKPYLWRQADLKRMIRTLVARHGSVGVLGVACIPELVSGIRRCSQYGIPVVGVPLDANRCERWVGEFRKNSVNGGMVEGMVG